MGPLRSGVHHADISVPDTQEGNGKGVRPLEAGNEGLGHLAEVRQRFRERLDMQLGWPSPADVSQGSSGSEGQQDVVLFALAKIWAVKLLQTLDKIADHGVKRLFHVDKLAANALLDQRGDFIRHCRMHR